MFLFAQLLEVFEEIRNPMALNNPSKFETELCTKDEHVIAITYKLLLKQ